MNRASSGYLAVADLDTYDGDTWTLQHTFEPTGGQVRLPTVSGQGNQAHSTVIQHYNVIDAPNLPWMPYLDQPTLVTGIGAEFDILSGMVIPSAELTNGQSYSVTSATTSKTLANFTSEQLTKLSADATTDPADSELSLGDVQYLDGVQTTLSDETNQSSAEAPLVFLAAIAAEFRTSYRRVPTSAYVASKTTTRALANGTSTRPDLYGTSLADIQASVFSKNKTGTPEQFATLVTLMARKLDIPARLVTGYRLSGPSREAAPTQPNVTYGVTNLDAWTWVEIYVENLGWVVVDPTPTSTGNPPIASTTSSTTTTTTQPLHRVQAAGVPGNSGHKLAHGVKLSLSGHSSGQLIVVSSVLGLVVLAGLVPGSVESLKARRRRRRRSASGSDGQIRGAWLETLDVLYEADVAGLSPMTNSEVASVVGQRFGEIAGISVATLATKANAVIFSTVEVQDTKAGGQAWSEFEVFRHALKSRQSGRERLRGLLRLAPRVRL
jgi:hypothetical protein